MTVFIEITVPKIKDSRVFEQISGAATLATHVKWLIKTEDIKFERKL